MTLLFIGFLLYASSLFWMLKVSHFFCSEKKNARKKCCNVEFCLEIYDTSLELKIAHGLDVGILFHVNSISWTSTSVSAHVTALFCRKVPALVFDSLILRKCTGRLHR